MCGIAGVLGGGRRGPAAVEAMVAAQRHRGPDDRGVWTGAGPLVEVALGATRLAILDLSAAGHMPMADPATGNVVVHNGEIYNFRALREDLQAEGEPFRSGTDTEVLLRAFRRWGQECLARLTGMFGFALLDAARREVLLARDRLGEKPLYYAEGPPFVFASEVRAVLASGLVDRRIDPQALDGYLANGFVVSPLTLVRGLRSLLPGHWLRVAADGRVTARGAYWSLPPGRAGDGPGLDDLRAQMEAATRARLVADVPLGAFLSGGLDSTAQVALMRRAGGDVRTFSLSFDEAAFDESAFAREAARRFATQHTEVKLGPAEFEAWLPDALAAYDQPSFDGLNAYYVARAAREAGLTVALSGSGADELFGGYPYFRQVPWLAGLSRLLWRAPAQLRQRASDRLSRAPWRLAGAWKTLAALGERPPSHPRGCLIGAYQLAQTLFPPWSRARLHEADEARRANWFGLPEAFLEVLLGEAGGGDDPDGVSRTALRLFLGERCLRDLDAMSMAVSLEVRAPFVDHGLVETALRVPGRRRCAGVPDKPFAWDLAAPWLHGYPRRRKQGFLFPFETWLRGGRARGTVRAALQAPETASGLGLAPVPLRGLAEDFFAEGAQGRVPWSRVWALYVLADWCRRHRVKA